MGKSSLDHLLARGAISGPEREQALEHILDSVAPRPKRGFGSYVLGATGIAACAAVVVVAGLRRRSGDEFAARGSATTGVRVELTCSDGSLDACHQRAHLLFATADGAQPGYLAAYAEPVGGGERIWYFSSDRVTPRVDPGVAPPSLSDRAIEVGPEHAPGRYSVHVLVAAQPLSRAQALHPDPGAILMSETIEMSVVP